MLDIKKQKLKFLLYIGTSRIAKVLRNFPDIRIDPGWDWYLVWPRSDSQSWAGFGDNCGLEPGFFCQTRSKPWVFRSVPHGHTSLILKLFMVGIFFLLGLFINQAILNRPTSILFQPLSGFKIRIMMTFIKRV